jgi:hypothetical protein
MENLTPEQKQQALFMQMVLMFHQAAWYQLGKIPNPMTNKVERDLDQARVSIDMLDMLKARTQGNLSEDESRVLEQVLRELKLNFVDELDREKKEKAAPQEGAGSPTASATS